MKIVAEGAGQTVESVSKIIRHVEYGFAETLDLRVSLGVASYFMGILRRCDRTPGRILLNSIESHGLTCYLTEMVTNAMLRGDKNYKTLDIMAVGEDERAKGFAGYLNNLARGGIGKAILGFGEDSRQFKISLEAGHALSHDAVGNFSLEAVPNFWEWRSSPIRLCVLTDEAYREMLKPVDEGTIE